MISVEEFRAFLTERTVEFEEQPTQLGTEFRCKTGEVFTVYTYSGKVVVRGTHTPLTDAVAARTS